MPWRGNNLDAGAMLALISGAIGIAVSVFIFVGWTRYSPLLQITAIAVFIAGILAIWGTRRYVLPGRNYPLAVLFGGVCAMASGALFGIMALILIATSKKEF